MPENSTFDNFVELCSRQLIGREVTVEQIRNTVDMFAHIPCFSNINIEDVVTVLRRNYNVTIDETQTLVDESHYTPWIEDFKNENREWPFWSRYRKYLELTQMPPKVIREIDKMTDNTLDRIFNPRAQQMPIKKKGLVVGQVQSGKTGNYIGLICKAADAGFNMIIVLAGALDDLRSQTQSRLDEGFLGFDTQRRRSFSSTNENWIGVGLIEHNNANVVANSYTTSANKGDFKRGNATTAAAGFNFLSRDPMVFVIKKNKAILNNLTQWLEDYQNSLGEKNLLLIDDEADHFSINTKNDGDRTAINDGIRRLLGLFPKAAYVGYTATPFANIFIDVNDDTDLFPRDFIISLPVPSNYVGPERFFGVVEDLDQEDDPKVIPAINITEDYRALIPDNHKKNDELPNEIPESMKTAIKCFILNCAIRRMRHQEKKHNSMLIHVSRYMNWHERIKELVENEFDTYLRCIEHDDPNFIHELKTMYENDSKSYKSYKTITNIVKGMDIGHDDINIFHSNWDDVHSQLWPAVHKIRVKAINGQSDDELNYASNTPVSVIAIGGDKLSRGLTLEGLSVSYFLRASKMYDTLMQMGRWFGYRPGYVDLCRLFLSGEVNEWYRHIAIATNELRNDFTYLYQTGGTPEHFALKVRTHPGVLKITALGKMRNADEMKVSWAGHLVETYQLLKTSAAIDRNLTATKTLLDSIGNPESNIGANVLWKNVRASLIERFLGDFVLPDSIVNFDLEAMVTFINNLTRKGEYDQWNVVLASPETDKNGTYQFNGHIKANMTLRNDANVDSAYYAIRKNHIISRDQDLIDLDDRKLNDAYNRANEEYQGLFRNEHPNDTKVPNLSKSKWARNNFRSKHTPLLLIYALAPSGTTKPDGTQFDEGSDPIIGFAISFPYTETTSAVSYRVNNTATMATLIESEDEFDSTNDNIYDIDNYD